MKRNRLIGNKAFYLMVLGIALPIMVQNGFTNFVNLLDNVMVGRLGTEEMSGVSIANQLNFVHNLCIFGAISGAGIFGSQYFGSKNDEGVRNTLRYKFLTGTFIVVIASILFLLKGDKLISIFLQGSDDGGDIASTLSYGMSYLRIMTIGLPGFMITQCFASTLREGGETVLPMKAGIIAITTNLAFNWLLIFGSLGFPRLGVDGAAIATVISRYVEAFIVIKGARKHAFMKGLLKTFRIPGKLAVDITKASAPLMANEAAWSIGMTFLVQCYSTRGLNAVAGYNIANTLNNLFTVTFLAIGTSIGIIVGQLLGAGKREEAIETDRKMVAFSVMIGASAGLVFCLLSPFFPMLYNTSSGAKTIATELMLAMGLCLPVQAFKNATYFTLRSGGKIFITILFDSVFMWTFGIPTAFLVSRFTNVGVVGIFLAVEACDIIKCVIGVYLVGKGVWANQLVEKN